MRMPSLLARSNSSSRRRSGAEWVRAVRVMVTMEITCAAIWLARGVCSTMRKLATQAAMLAAIVNASRKKVRQNSPLLSHVSRFDDTVMRASFGGKEMSGGMDGSPGLWSAWLAFGDEDITEPPDGLDVQRRRWIGFDQLAQARDLHVEAAVEDFVFAAARQFHQLFARQRLTCMAREHLEHREFAGGQRYGFTIFLQRTRAEVELEIAEREGLRRLRRRARNLVGTDAAQHG